MNWLIALPLLLPAQADVTLLQPAGGFLVADGVSHVPLELMLHSASLAPAIVSAEIRCHTGRVDRIRALTGDRVAFDYLPVRSNGYEEEVTAELKFADGTSRQKTLTFRVHPAKKPELRFSIGPEAFAASAPPPIEVRAASPDSNTQVIVSADRGELSFDPRLEPAELSARLKPPELPPDAPSYLMLLAVAASQYGYSARVSGTSAHASMKLSFDLSPGEKLVVEGAENKLRPAKARNGRATIGGSGYAAASSWCVRRSAASSCSTGPRLLPVS